jgi:cAMP-specific phosphodiesterase 4
MRNIHYFYVASDLGALLTPLEVFAGLFAGAVHDVQHPGLNNQFLCNTEHAIAITYNDTSVLENMHCATAFSIAKTTHLLEGVPEQSRQMFRKIVVAMVLDTDMALHFSSLAKFKANVSDALALGVAGDVTPEGRTAILTTLMADTEIRLMVMQMCIKNADVANAAKPWDNHEQWSKRVLAEFFNQGEMEEKQGLPVSVLCDRKGGNVWNSQIGFIDFIITPLFSTWCGFLGSKQVDNDLLVNIRANRARWAEKKEEDCSQQPYKDAQLLEENFFEIKHALASINEKAEV